MNILIFSEIMYPHGGGAELATWLYLKNLSERGFKIKVITGRFPRESSYEKLYKDIEVYRVALKGSGGITSSRYFTLTNIDIAFSYFARRLIQWADVVYIPGGWYTVLPVVKMYKKPAVVHLHNYSIVSPSSVILSNDICGKSVIQDFVCQERIKRGVLGSLMSTFLNELVGKYVNEMGTMSDAIICVSNRQADIIIKRKPSLAEKIKVIYNPLPDIKSPRKEPSEKPTLMYVGGESYLKGFHLLLKAINILRKKGYVNFELVMTNSYSENSLRFIKHLKSRGINVRVLGRVNYDDLIALHSQAWALIFPSVWEEPLPYAIVEAMLLGTIPIASRVGGVVELVKNTVAENFVFPPMDEIQLAKKMIKCIDTMDEKQIRQYSSELRRNILSRLNTEKSVDELIRLFSELTNEL